MEGMSAPERLNRLTRAFDEAGGTGAKVLIRRVWLGRLRSELIAEQRAVYESYATGAGAFGADQTIASDDPVKDSGADSLNLRVQLPGMEAAHVREQIEGIGSSVTPLLKVALPRR
jgi:hypothetical protein